MCNFPRYLSIITSKQWISLDFSRIYSKPEQKKTLFLQSEKYCTVCSYVIIVWKFVTKMKLTTILLLTASVICSSWAYPGELVRNNELWMWVDSKLLCRDLFESYDQRLFSEIYGAVSFSMKKNVNNGNNNSKWNLDKSGFNKLLIKDGCDLFVHFQYVISQ